jgi:hypothetical protein
MRGVYRIIPARAVDDGCCANLWYGDLQAIIANRLDSDRKRFCLHHVPSIPLPFLCLRSTVESRFMRGASRTACPSPNLKH